MSERTTYLIPLNPDEEKIVFETTKKAIESADRYAVNNYTVPSDRFETHRLGVRCEFAVAKFLGYKDLWNKYDFATRKQGDIKNLEVRGTFKEWRFSGIMLSRKRDHADRRYIFCSYSKKPWIEIVGWEWGNNILKDENKFVRPQFPDELYRMAGKDLQPINKLLNELWYQTKGEEHGQRTERTHREAAHENHGEEEDKTGSATDAVDGR